MQAIARTLTRISLFVMALSLVVGCKLSDPPKKRGAGGEPPEKAQENSLKEGAESAPEGAALPARAVENENAVMPERPTLQVNPGAIDKKNRKRMPRAMKIKPINRLPANLKIKRPQMKTDYDRVRRAAVGAPEPADEKAAQEKPAPTEGASDEVDSDGQGETDPAEPTKGDSEAAE